MKTVTTREAQHHLSKVLEIVSAGEEVVITRRGKQVALMSKIASDQGEERRVDWSESVRRRNENLCHVPQRQRNIIVELREEERY